MGDAALVEGVLDPLVRAVWKARDFFGNALKRYNAPFIVYRAEWNPCIDLIALASEKGEINTRRRGWKRGWKVSLSGVKPLPHGQNCDNDSSKMGDMCWSPSGMFLAVGFQNGVVHLLDREHGHVVYSISLGCVITKMRWGRFLEEVKIDVDDCLVGLVGEMQAKSKKSEKPTTVDNIDLLKNFCDQFAHSELLGAVLMVVDEDNVVHILAAGILPIFRISPPMDYFENCDPYSITIGDVYLSKDSKLLVVYSSAGQSTASASESGVSYGYNTQVVSFELDSLGWFKNGFIWKITYRWLRVYCSVCCVSDAFSKMTSDWEEQSKHFHRAFKMVDMKDTDGQTLTVAECLVGHILNGDSELELQRYFRELKEDDWKRMKEWAGRDFSKLILMLKNDLWTGVELYQHHLKQLINDLEFSTQSRANINVLPKRIYDVDIYPYGGYDEKSENVVRLKGLLEILISADHLHFKVAELIAVATCNRKELLNFMRWLSFTSAFKNKEPSFEPNTSMKFDLASVIEYIVEVLVLPDNRGSAGLSKQIESLYRKKCNRSVDDAVTVDKKENDDHLTDLEQKSVDAHLELEKKPMICFDQVIDYFKTSDQLKAVVNLKNNDYLGPETPNQARKRARLTLAQCVKDCVLSLDLIRTHILEIYSPISKPAANLYLEQLRPEGFSSINFFIFRIPVTSCTNPKVWEDVKLKFNNDKVLALSCIGTDGRRHCFYAASGELICQTIFDGEISVVQCKGDAKMSEALKQKKTENTSASFDQPLFIDTDAGSSKSPLNTTSTLSNFCLIQLESVDDGTYFGLIRAKRKGIEFTFVFRAFFDRRGILLHEDQSGAESFEKIVVSGSRKLGIAILEPQYTVSGSCLRWFDFNEKVAYIHKTSRTILGERDFLPALTSLSNNSFGENEEPSKPGATFGSEMPPDTSRPGSCRLKKKKVLE